MYTFFFLSSSVIPAAWISCGVVPRDLKSRKLLRLLWQPLWFSSSVGSCTISHAENISFWHKQQSLFSHSIWFCMPSWVWNSGIGSWAFPGLCVLVNLTPHPLPWCQTNLIKSTKRTWMDTKPKTSAHPLYVCIFFVLYNLKEVATLFSVCYTAFISSVT